MRELLPERALALFNRFMVKEWMGDPEATRRGRLIVSFGFLGLFFGLSYAAFYVAIGHYWGSVIVLVCSIGFGATPFLLRWTHRLQLAGNVLSAIMTLGFVALCGVEGGMRGHAVAWLASVPLCALLVSGKKSARFWVLICFVVCALVIIAELRGIELPTTYDPAWHSLVNSAGYIGLIAFMFALGMIFESSRESAFTKMQDALARLVQSNEQLTLLNKEKTEFLGIAAHDLRNPLSTIIGYSQIMQENAKPDEVAQFSGAILKAGTRMRDLIVNLLDANAVEEGRFSCKIERCQASTLIEQSVGHHQTSAKQKGITLEFSPAPDFQMMADKSTTVQILDNLISNAVKYSPFDTTVRIHAATDDRTVTIAVQDEGPGLTPRDKQKLFGKFTRLSARPTNGESSTGLGLSIVKRLAEAMSGSVSCESEHGHGAIFSLRLPSANPQF